MDDFDESVISVSFPSAPRKILWKRMSEILKEIFSALLRHTLNGAGWLGGAVSALKKTQSSERIVSHIRGPRHVGNILHCVIFKFHLYVRKLM